MRERPRDADRGLLLWPEAQGWAWEWADCGLSGWSRGTRAEARHEAEEQLRLAFARAADWMRRQHG